MSAWEWFVLAMGYTFIGIMGLTFLWLVLWPLLWGLWELSKNVHKELTK